jgi:RNA polymerase sigma factor (sigma-70 family)
MSVQELAVEPIDRKIERSSFGTPAARRRRQHTSPAVARDIRALVEEHDEWTDRLVDATVQIGSVSFLLEVLCITELEATHSERSWERLVRLIKVLKTSPGHDHLPMGKVLGAIEMLQTKMAEDLLSQSDLEPDVAKAAPGWMATAASKDPAGRGVARGDAMGVTQKDGFDFAAFYTRSIGAAQAVCRRFVRDRNTVDDIVQSVFVEALDERLWERLAEDELNKWLRGRVRREALRHLQNLDRRRRQTIPIHEVSEQVDAIADPVSDPAELLVQAEQRALVLAALEGLSSDDQLVLRLWMQELNGRRLAEALQLPVKLVHVRVHRARQRLLASLGALLIARHGRAWCEGLAGMLEGWDGRLQPVVRKRIVRHVQQCAHCGHLEWLLTNPEQVL